MTNYNAPIFTLYLLDTEATLNSDGSYSWTVYWGSIFPMDQHYENYLMTHSFTQEYSRDAGPQSGILIQQGIPIVMNSNSKGACSIINVWDFVLTSSLNPTDVVNDFIGKLTCSPNTSLISGVHSLTSTVVTLTFQHFDGTNPNIAGNFVHIFKFTPILNK